MVVVERRISRHRRAVGNTQVAKRRLLARGSFYAYVQRNVRDNYGPGQRSLYRFIAKTRDVPLPSPHPLNKRYERRTLIPIYHSPEHAGFSRSCTPVIMFRPPSRSRPQTARSRYSVWRFRRPTIRFGPNASNNCDGASRRRPLIV